MEELNILPGTFLDIINSSEGLITDKGITSRWQPGKRKGFC